VPTRLISRRYPKLKIWIPSIEEYRQLEGGVLDIADDDPALDELKAKAAKSPHLEIRKVTGSTAEGRPTTTTIKGAGEFVCDACNPPAVFDDEAGLADHTAELHAARPVLGEDGSDTAATDRPAVRQGTVTSRGSRSNPKGHPNTRNSK
jgi:hypothetical protein